MTGACGRREHFFLKTASRMCCGDLSPQKLVEMISIACSPPASCSTLAFGYVLTVSYTHDQKTEDQDRMWPLLLQYKQAHAAAGSRSGSRFGSRSGSRSGTRTASRVSLQSPVRQAPPTIPEHQEPDTTFDPSLHSTALLEASAHDVTVPRPLSSHASASNIHMSPTRVQPLQAASNEVSVAMNFGSDIVENDRTEPTTTAPGDDDLVRIWKSQSLTSSSRRHSKTGQSRMLPAGLPLKAWLPLPHTLRAT